MLSVPSASVSGRNRCPPRATARVWHAALRPTPSENLPGPQSTFFGQFFGLVNDRARWIIVTAVVDVLLYPYLLPDRRRCTTIKLVYHPLGIEDGAGKPGNLLDTEALHRMQKPEFVSQACAEK
jgi:hypothetical protein